MNSKHTFNYIFGSASQALFPIILFPILTRTIDKNNFGNLITAISIATVLSYVFSLVLPAIIARQIIFDQKNAEKLKNYVNQLSSLILIIIYFINLIIIFLPVSSTFKTIIFVITGGIFLSFAQIKLSIYRSEFKSYLFVLLSIGSNGLPLLITTFLTKLTKIDSLMVYFFTMYSIILLFLNPTVNPNFSGNIKLKPLIKSSYPMIAHGVAISLFQYGDKIAGYFGSNSLIAAEIGILSLILTGPVLLLNTLNNVWLPSSLEKFRVGLKKGFAYSNQIANRLSLIISLVVIAILLLLNKILEIYVSKDYDVLLIEKTLIGSIFITPLYVIYLQNSHLITVKKNFKILGIATPITSTIQFLLTYVLVEHIGLIAVGYGFIAAIFLQVMLTSIFSKNIKNVSLAPIYYTLFLGIFSYFIYVFRF